MANQPSRPLGPGRRLITVSIPDLDSVERTVRYAAERTCQGMDIIVVDRPAGIPDSWMPQLHGELTERVQQVRAVAVKNLANVLNNAQVQITGRPS